MGVLQRVLNKLIKKEFNEGAVTRALWRRVLVKKLPRLSKRHLDEAVDALCKLPGFSGTIRIGSGRPTWHVEIGSDDLFVALAETEKVLGRNIQRATQSCLTAVSRNVLKDIRRRATRELEVGRLDVAAFESRLYDWWSKALDPFEVLVDIAREAGQAFVKRIKPARARRNGNLIRALVALHVRACRTYSEIAVLLKSGYADGANARWRSLHELMIVAQFLSDHDDAVAERYLNHDAVEQHKAAQEYQRHCNALGFAPLKKSHLKIIARKRDDAIAKFGKPFGEDYGWAADALGNKRPRFAQIEEAVDLSRWRPFYRMASYSVHAGARGLHFSLGVPEYSDVRFSAGASNAGLCDPGQNAALSLMMITILLLTTEPEFDDLVACRIIQRLANEIGREFAAAESRMERAERSVRRRVPNAAAGEEKVSG